MSHEITYTIESAGTVDESDFALFTITRHDGFSLPTEHVVLSYAGTARASEDYQEGPWEVILPAGQRSVTFALETLADLATEGSETIAVRMNHVVEAATVGDPQTYRVLTHVLPAYCTILDTSKALEERPPVSLPPPASGPDLSGSDRTDGDAFANFLQGMGGDDALWGHGGNDTLAGGTGNDWLRGGAGRDKFLFAEMGRANRDTISGFSPKDDTILLDNAAFTRLTDGDLRSSQFWASTSGRAHDRSDRLLYDTNDGILYYDPDGTGAAARVQFALIAKNLKVTANDFDIL